MVPAAGRAGVMAAGRPAVMARVKHAISADAGGNSRQRAPPLGGAGAKARNPLMGLGTLHVETLIDTRWQCAYFYLISTRGFFICVPLQLLDS